MELSSPGPVPPSLLADILQYAHSPHCGPGTPECQHDMCCHSCNNCQNNLTYSTCQHLQTIQVKVPCQRNGANKSCCQEDTCCHCQTTYSQREQCCVHAYTQQQCSQCQLNKCQHENTCGSGCVVERSCGCRVRRMPSNAGSEDLVPDIGVLKVRFLFKFKRLLFQ